MSSLKNLGRVALALTATSLASALLVAACSDNSNSQPPVFGDDGGNDATSSGGGGDGSPEGSTSNPDGSGGNPDAAPDSSPSGGDAGDTSTADSAPSCTAVLSDAGCWTCPAQSAGSVEFLNQCSGTGVTCVSFDNLGRLPGFDAGLPHL